MQATNLTFVMAMCLTVFLGCDRQQEPLPGVPVKTGAVTLEFSIDGEVKTVLVPDVREEATLESVLRQVDETGEVEIDISGSGTTAFVNSIGGKSTSAAEGWIYKIDGNWVNKGVGATPLSPPTTVSWQFGDWAEAQPASKEKSDE